MQEVDLPSPGPDERSLAMLAHALQIVGGFIAPLVIFLIRRDSRFVGFHALQTLLLQLAYLCLWFILFGSVTAGVVVFMSRESGRERRPTDHKATAEATQTQKPSEEKAQEGKSTQQESPQPESTDDRQDKKRNEPPPVWLLLSFFIFWGFQMLVWLLMVVVAIAYSVKASRGEWTAYPVVGRWARRILA